jgi:hypothetical protein
MVQDRSRLSTARASQPQKTSPIGRELRVPVLESVFGATPHEFESRILRHSPSGHPISFPLVKRIMWSFAGDVHTEGRFPSGNRPSVVPSQFSSQLS